MMIASETAEADLARRKTLRQRYGWRWWRSSRFKWTRVEAQRPRIGPRRFFSYLVIDSGGEGRFGDTWRRRRRRAGRAALLVRSAVRLEISQVESGPYVEDYAEWVMAPWWRRRLQAARSRRGSNIWRRIRWAHALQRKR